jgi:hypothetical protein
MRPDIRGQHPHNEAGAPGGGAASQTQLPQQRPDSTTHCAPARITWVVDPGTAAEDRTWFADHPKRRFRYRPGDGGLWLIRRYKGALVRTFAPGTSKLSPNTDHVLAVAFFQAAYPNWSPEQVKRWAHKSNKRRAP